MHCALEIADRIAVLFEGEVVAFGSPDELRRSEVPLVKDFLAEVLAEEAAQRASQVPS